MAVSEAEARAIVLAQLANDDWEPAVVGVEDTGEDWRVFYNTRVFVETGGLSHALAGNLPMLVDKSAAAVTTDDVWPSGT